MAVEVPSDNPSAYATLTVDASTLARLNARNTAMTTSLGDAQLEESTLAQATDLVNSAHDIAVEMANGQNDAAQRASEAQAIQGISSSLLGLANTQGARGYLFGGTATATPPFDQNGNFMGNDGAIGVEIADNTTIQANTSGAQAFTAAGDQDIFGDLASLSTALANNDVATIQSLIDPLAQAGTQLVTADSSAGIIADRLTSATQILSMSAGGGSGAG
jgi:flagellar hook-associated protein 3 FlgL